jgi:hypothetical protein
VVETCPQTIRNERANRPKRHPLSLAGEPARRGPDGGAALEGAAVPTSGNSFQRRVTLLRDSWAERRQLKHLAGAHDFASQFALLRTVYGWAEDATADIQEVYGGDLNVSLSPAPLPARDGTGFSITIGNQFTVAFALAERHRGAGARWFVTVTVGSDGARSPAGPERRNGHWTRTRLEDTLLSALGAYERSFAAVEGATG